MTQKQICLKYHLYHVGFFRKGTMELLKSSPRGKVRLGGRDGTFLSKKTGQGGWLDLEMGCGEEGQKETRLPTWLRASLPTSPQYFTASPSVAGCQPAALETPEYSARITWEWPFLSYLNPEKQELGGEESRPGERCWSDVSCRARRTLRGGAAGLPRELPGDVVYEVSVTPRRLENEENCSRWASG